MQWTRQDIRDSARSMMTKVGQVPVSLNREMPGFVLNRMQYALLNECFRLVLEDVGKFEEVASIITLHSLVI